MSKKINKMKDNTLREKIEYVAFEHNGEDFNEATVLAIEALLAEEVRKAILAGWQQSREGYNNEEDYNNEYWSGKMTLDEIEKQVIEDALAELEKEGK